MTAPRSPIFPSEERGSRESTDPPPPFPGREVDAARERAEHAVGKARKALVSADAAEDGAAEAREGVLELKAMVGNSPDPVLGVPGRGLFGVVATLVSDVHLIGTKVDGLVAASAADRAAAEKAVEARRGSTARMIGWFAGPTAAIIVGAVIAYLSGFHR